MNYCVTYSLYNGLYCTKLVHSHFLLVHFCVQQECTPVRWAQPACLPHPVVPHVSQGVWPTPPPWMQTPWMQIPPVVGPLDVDPLGHVTCDRYREANLLPMDRMTDACENITLAQTSFAGGNNRLCT